MCETHPPPQPAKAIMDFSPATQLHDATPCLLLLLWGSVSRLLMEPQHNEEGSLKCLRFVFYAISHPKKQKKKPPKVLQKPTKKKAYKPIDLERI